MLSRAQNYKDASNNGVHVIVVKALFMFVYNMNIFIKNVRINSDTIRK